MQAGRSLGLKTESRELNSHSSQITHGRQKNENVHPVTERGRDSSEHPARPLGSTAAETEASEGKGSPPATMVRSLT